MHGIEHDKIIRGICTMMLFTRSVGSKRRIKGEERGYQSGQGLAGRQANRDLQGTEQQERPHWRLPQLPHPELIWDDHPLPTATTTG